MKQLLWLGSFMNEETNQAMTSQGYKNAASYISQKNLLEGIEAETEMVFDTINAVSMAGYPKQGGIVMRTYEYSHTTGARDILMGYLNPLYLNKFFMKQAMLSGIKEWIRMRYKGGGLDVFVYEMRSACLDAANYLKKEVPHARIHLIIPDLPCFMDLNMSTLKKALKEIDWNQMVSRFDCINDFFPYTETMVDYLGIRDRKWMVVEGSLNQKEIERITSDVDGFKGKSTNKNIIMYSGWIDKSFGIDALVEAMEYLDDTYELWITGGGPYETGLKERVLANPKVKYYGFLPMREDLLKLQAQASVMINIRDPQIEAAHYCFPSKLFEYMLFGVPVLSVRLRGIPDEYRKYLFEFDSLEPKVVADAIQGVMADGQREERAMAGRQFVKEQKNNFAMAKKIIEFVEE